MSNHSSTLPTVAAAICRGPLAELGAGGTSGSITAVDDMTAPGLPEYEKGSWRLHDADFAGKAFPARAPRRPGPAGPRDQSLSGFGGGGSAHCVQLFHGGVIQLQPGRLDQVGQVLF